MQWPFVTLNDFAPRAATVLSLTDALYVWIAPLVEEKELLEWQQYSVNNSFWMRETLGEDGQVHAWYEDEVPTVPLLPFVFNLNGGTTPTPVAGVDPGPYAPIWQGAPPVASLPNFNLFNRKYSTN